MKRVLHRHGSTFLGALACVLAIVCARHACAQVNTEVLRPDRATEGISGDLDASFAYAHGNVELLDVGGGGRIRYQTLHPVPAVSADEPAPLPYVAQQAFILAKGRFAQHGKEAFVSQAFSHARWTAMWIERVGSELFVQYQYNQFQRLLARALGGVGARVEIVHVPACLIWAGTGYMFEYNRIDVLEGANDSPSSYEHRSTSYLATRVELFDSELLLQNTVYLQPRFDKPSDFRLLEEFEAQSKITEVFALGVRLGLLHDSAPPTGVKHTDIQIASTLHVSL